MITRGAVAGKTLIRGGRVVDPEQGLDEVCDVYIEAGNVMLVEKNLHVPEDATVIEAAGLVVCPGLIDMHVHLREPGAEGSETIESGAAAAVAGGFSAIVAMPNTEPPMDSESSVAYMYLKGSQAGGAKVFPTGTVTKGRLGESISEMGLLAEAGAVAFTDDGSTVMNAGTMLSGLRYASMFDIPVLAHCEDANLSGGVMSAGKTATILGLRGNPPQAEELIIARDILLAEMADARLHVQHVSTAGGVDIVRRAKARGAKVTAEVTPHHFTLTDEALRSYDPVYKVAPPLRTAADIAALKQGLADGTIDVIASDHAPHSVEQKSLEIVFAPFGIIGMETVLALAITKLVDEGVLDIPGLVEKLSVNPSRILNLGLATLRKGQPADITIFDPSERWTVDRKKLKSRSENCPYHGMTLTGKAKYVIVDGVTHEL